MSYQPNLPGFTMSDESAGSFDIDEALKRIEEAVEPFPKAALFELAEDGHDSPFEQLVACIISIRTRDETMYPTAKALFEKARTPAAMAAMTVEEIDEIIEGSSFHERKAGQIAEISQRIVEEYEGELPCDQAVLLDFHGVGPKCANLVMGIACREAYLGVDVHVHRITNRWGFVDTNRPKQTMKSLEQKLPRQYWVEINRLLVPFGKHICTGRLPKCSSCPVESICAQVGVENHR